MVADDRQTSDSSARGALVSGRRFSPSRSGWDVDLRRAWTAGSACSSSWTGAGDSGLLPPAFPISESLEMVSMSADAEVLSPPLTVAARRTGIEGGESGSALSSSAERDRGGDDGATAIEGTFATSCSSVEMVENNSGETSDSDSGSLLCLEASGQIPPRRSCCADSKNAISSMFGMTTDS
jgi:hypothetical protein